MFIYIYNIYIIYTFLIHTRIIIQSNIHYYANSANKICYNEYTSTAKPAYKNLSSISDYS